MEKFLSNLHSVVNVGLNRALPLMETYHYSTSFQSNICKKIYFEQQFGLRCFFLLKCDASRTKLSGAIVFWHAASRLKKWKCIWKNGSQSIISGIIIINASIISMLVKLIRFLKL